MCEDCAKEYHDPSDRRFHAQPVACAKCGPFAGVAGCPRRPHGAGGRDRKKQWNYWKRANIIAIKGLGGYHLACDALNEGALRELRKRKHRDGKPFALMAKDMETVLQYCCINDKESALLQSVQKPIVLLDVRSAEGLAMRHISADNHKIGIMLALYAAAPSAFLQAI